MPSKWWTFASLKHNLDTESLTDSNKLLFCADHYYAISGRLATQRSESKKQVCDGFKNMEKISEKELEKEIEKTLNEWQKIHSKIYDEWKAGGVEIEREHKDETIFTFPYPHPPGFKPEKQKVKEQQRRNILTGAKRKFERREKRMKKERPQKRVRAR